MDDIAKMPLSVDVHNGELPRISDDSRDFMKSVTKTEKKRSSVKRKRRNALTETTQDRLLAWIDFYSSVNYGIWVQCCQCQKWRWVDEYEESYQVPNIWKCSMNKDETKSSCEAPEEYEGAEFTTAEYVPGSIVWAKMTSYPWWPAMIEDDPDIEEYYWIDAQTKRVTQYHVTFLDKKPTRSWIPVSCVRHFVRKEKLPKLQGRSLLLLPLLHSAQERALDALNLSLSDRLRRYSFAYTYIGKWPCAENDTEVDKLETTLNETKMLIQEVDDLDSLYSSDLDSSEDTQVKGVFKQPPDLSVSSYRDFENILLESVDSAAVFTSSQSSQVIANKAQGKTRPNEVEKSVSKKNSSLGKCQEKIGKKETACKTKDMTKMSVKRKKFPTIISKSAESLKTGNDNEASEILSHKTCTEISNGNITDSKNNCSAQMQDVKKKKKAELSKKLKCSVTQNKEKIPNNKKKLLTKPKCDTQNNNVREKKNKLCNFIQDKLRLEKSEAACNVVHESQNSDFFLQNRNGENWKVIDSEDKQTIKNCSNDVTQMVTQKNESLTTVVSEVTELKMGKNEMEEIVNTSSEIIGNSQTKGKQYINVEQPTNNYHQDISDEHKENKNMTNSVLKLAKKDHKKPKDKLKKDSISTNTNKQFNFPLKRKQENSNITAVSEKKKSKNDNMKPKKNKKPVDQSKVINSMEDPCSKTDEMATAVKSLELKSEKIVPSEKFASSKMDISFEKKSGEPKLHNKSSLESEKVNGDTIKLASKIKAKRFQPPVANGLTSGSKVPDEVKECFINPIQRSDDVKIISEMPDAEIAEKCPNEPEYIKLEALAKQFAVNVAKGNCSDDGEDSDPFDYD